MEFEQALVYELQMINGLSGKVFPQQAPENSKPPFVVYFSSEGENIMTLTGATDIVELTCEIHVISETYDGLKSLTKAVLDRIKSFFGRTIGREGFSIKSLSYVEPTEEMDDDLGYLFSTFNITVRF